MSVEKTCKILEVSRNAYYDCKKDPRAEKNAFKTMVTKEVIAIYELIKQTYGGPRITEFLHNKGIMVSRQFIARIMSCEGLRDIDTHNQTVKQSISRKGNCWDNALGESFFKTIKYERLNRYNFKSNQEAKKVVLEYIEHWYNRMR